MKQGSYRSDSVLPPLPRVANSVFDSRVLALSGFGNAANKLITLFTSGGETVADRSSFASKRLIFSPRDRNSSGELSALFFSMTLRLVRAFPSVRATCVQRGDQFASCICLHEWRPCTHPVFSTTSGYVRLVQRGLLSTMSIPACPIVFGFVATTSRPLISKAR